MLGLVAVALWVMWVIVGYRVGVARNSAALGTVAAAIAGPIGILVFLLVVRRPKLQ